jgi:hypothetical protein
VTDDDVKALAKRAGFYLESWMTNPPKPAMWHGPPEAMRRLLLIVATDPEVKRMLAAAITDSEAA